MGPAEWAVRKSCVPPIGQGLLESKVNMRGNRLPMQSVTCWIGSSTPLKRDPEQSCSVVRLGLDRCPQGFRYFARDVVLDRQDVAQRPVVGFRPDNIPAVSPD